eukprot:7381714-Alexandrium_andersonii.AAC.1
MAAHLRPSAASRVHRASAWTLRLVPPRQNRRLRPRGRQPPAQCNHADRATLSPHSDGRQGFTDKGSTRLQQM